MKITFLGIEPSSTLREFLSSNQFTLSVLKRFPQKGKTDIVLFAPKNLEALSECERIRTLFPKAWFSLIIKPAWFEKPVLREQLMIRSDHDALWVKDHWEETLLFSLSKMTKQIGTMEELSSIEKQCKTLKTQVDELSQKSEHLISQLERDVALATNIQRSLIPKKAPDIPGITLATKYIPAQGAGGDYFDIFEFGDKKRFGILIADSKSHGMAAALLTVLIKVRLEEMKERFPDSKSFLTHINQEIQNVHKKEMASLSLLYGILDRSTLTFQYTSAGNLSPLLWRHGELVSLEATSNPSLGEVTNYDFKEDVVTLKPSDLVLFATDGLDAPLADAESPNTKAVLTNILSHSDLNPDPLTTQNAIMAKVDKYLENSPLEDDLTLIQLHIEERTLYVASESK